MGAKESLARRISTPIQVLVEGKTPEIFFREMVEHLGSKDRIQVRDYEGINSLTAYLKTFANLEDFKEKETSLGVIRDAEDKPADAAFQSVCQSLKAVGIEPPQKPGEVQPQSFKVGVFILPNCQDPGMLETVCLQFVAQAHAKELGCINRYFECLSGKDIGVSPSNVDKAKTWAFLSAKGSFDPQVGRAAQAKVWDWENRVFEPLRDFLNALSQNG
jgi:hypothetical protein